MQLNNYIYLDWAASAPVKYFAKDYYIPGNANSSHALGLQANQALNEARQRIMDCLGVKSGKVLFCRCATEAVEWLCNKYRERAIDINLNRKIMGEQFNQYERLSIWCSQYEHDLVKAVPPKYQDDWRNCGLYLYQYVNQITGTVFDIESISKQVNSQEVGFGSDFTAAIGHYPLPNNIDSFCDAVWFSGHKFGCEPGIGAIWLSDRLFKYLGGSEDSRNNYGLLHGTPNVSGAIAMSYAMEHAVREAKTNNVVWGQLVNYMCTKLLENNVLHHIHDIDNPHKTYAINALYLPNINADALTQYLSTKSIYISPGHSACAENDDYRVLEAFGLTKEQASQTVRISFGESNTQEDIDALVNGIVEFKNLFVK